MNVASSYKCLQLTNVTGIDVLLLFEYVVTFFLESISMLLVASGVIIYDPVNKGQ